MVKIQKRTFLSKVVAPNLLWANNYFFQNLQKRSKLAKMQKTKKPI
tara:strand:+ start:2913 stop:3050 length:138 start_codon:yes stop_codon:yes gene_type:complete